MSKRTYVKSHPVSHIQPLANTAGANANIVKTDDNLNSMVMPLTITTCTLGLPASGGGIAELYKA